LFSETRSAGPIDESVRLLSAPDAGREAREAVRTCMRWAGEGIEFHEMAIAYRHPDPYRGLLDAGFREAGIPVYLHEGSPLSERPVGRRVTALLELVDSRFQRARIMSFLSDARLPDETWKRYGEPSITRWDGISRKAGVVEGAEQWRERLDGLAARERDRDGHDEPEPEWLPAHIADVEALRAFVSDLHDALESRPRAATFSGHLDYLRALLADYVSDAAPLLSALSDLARLDALDAPMSFEGFADMVLTTLSSLRSEVALGARQGAFGLRGVNVLDVNTLRHLRFRAVAVVGLSERLFPPPPRQDPLLLDDERDGLGVPLRARGPDPEPLQFALAAQAASDRLQLSFPRAQLGQRTAMLPSGFFRAAAGALHGESVAVAKIDQLPEHLYVRVPASRIGAAAPELAINEREYERTLLETSPALGAAVIASRVPRFLAARDAEMARWKPRFTVYDGVLDSTGVTALAQRGTLERPMSASKLQSYAKCPYSFFLDAVIGVKEPTEPEAIVQIDAMTRGSVMHRIYEQFMSARTDDPIHESRRKAQLSELTKIAERECAEAEAEGLTGYEVIWRQDRARIMEDLRGWYEAELQDASAEVFNKSAYELSFGFDDEKPIQISIGGERMLRLHGFIDRLQWRSRGHAFRVIDYKTGKVWGEDGALDGGQALQLPLYLHAAASYLKTDPEHGEAEYFYSTRLGGYSRVRFTSEDLKNRREDLESLLRGMLDAASGGDFHAEPGRHCERCAYDSICDPRRRAIRKAKKHDPFALAFEDQAAIE
jgi:ATP-dependent helicase/DNAse subunit B